MQFINYSDLEAFYELFVNALSFTVAINAVDSAANVSDLLPSGWDGVCLLLFGMICKNLLQPILEDVAIRSRSSDNGLASFILGPLRATKFLISKFITVVTHFLSTTLGRWLFVTLGDEDLPQEDIVLVTLVTLTLTWLISVSAGFIEPVLKPDSPLVEMQGRLGSLEVKLNGIMREQALTKKTR